MASFRTDRDPGDPPPRGRGGRRRARSAHRVTPGAARTRSQRVYCSPGSGGHVRGRGGRAGIPPPPVPAASPGPRRSPMTDAPAQDDLLPRTTPGRRRHRCGPGRTDRRLPVVQRSAAATVSRPTTSSRDQAAPRNARWRFDIGGHRFHQGRPGRVPSGTIPEVTTSSRPASAASTTRRTGDYPIAAQRPAQLALTEAVRCTLSYPLGQGPPPKDQSTPRAASSPTIYKPALRALLPDPATSSSGTSTPSTSPSDFGAQRIKRECRCGSAVGNRSDPAVRQPP